MTTTAAPELRHRFCAVVLLVLLTWQGGAAFVDLARTVRGPRRDAELRWDSTEDQRIRGKLGEDYEIYRTIHDLVPEGAFVVTRLHNTRHGRFLLSYLTNLLYPRQLVLRTRLRKLVEQGALAIDDSWFLLDLHLGEPLEIPLDGGRSKARLREIASGNRFTLYANEASR